MLPGAAGSSRTCGPSPQTRGDARNSPTKKKKYFFPKQPHHLQLPANSLHDPDNNVHSL